MQRKNMSPQERQARTRVARVAGKNAKIRTWKNRGPHAYRHIRVDLGDRIIDVSSMWSWEHALRCVLAACRVD